MTSNVRHGLVREDLALVVIAASVEGIAYGVWLGGLLGGAPSIGPGIIVGGVSAVISAVVGLVAAALLPLRTHGPRMAAALAIGGIAAFVIAYLIQPVGRPV